MKLTPRLAAPAPGWTTHADVVVVGSGVAGLSVALGARQAGLDVLLVTKALLDDGSTKWAQGGIAAVLGSDDDPDEHLQDTLVAGVGLCDEEAVRVLVDEGPVRVRELAALGATFDLASEGLGDGHGSSSPEGFALTREGGHHRDRIVHAGGDATGAEVQRALAAAVYGATGEQVRTAGVRVVEHAVVLDLLKDSHGKVAGLTLHVLDEGQTDGVGAVHASAVVLATGGLGQVFASTTNPGVSTGDGVALALRAGAVVGDLEFVQFHPTAMWLGGAARGQQPLISEAVRGEGAVLVDSRGERVITTADHPLADLAPRDVVAKAITRRMHALGDDHVLLDARHLGSELLEHRFPTIVARCRELGVDPVTEPIPVAPAAHYASGGVRTDLHGRSSVAGLWAVGEVACTGVHGANRLASNSLLEGLVFAHRIVEDLVAARDSGELRSGRAIFGAAAEGGLLDPGARSATTRAMTDGVGVLRSQASVDAALKTLGDLPLDGAPGVDAWEATALHTVASLIAAAAGLRTETRGCHWREDFADAAPFWEVHIVHQMAPDGVVTTQQVLHPWPALADLPVVAAAAPVDVLSVATRTSLLDAGLDPDAVVALVRMSVTEDLDGGVDVTSVSTVPADLQGTADVVPRQNGTLAGVAVAAAVFETLDLTTSITVKDGTRVTKGDVVLTVTGPVRALLTAERTALNLLCHLSGIATLTSTWVDTVQGTSARIRDTRKTTPGLRALEKYAVRAGGGVNHRMSLSDAALVKDNHVVAAGGVARAFELVRETFPGLDVEVECDTVEQVREVVAAGADLVLLDNMTVADLVASVAICNAAGVRTEASGGLSLAVAHEVAQTGVDYLAIGALTHSAPVLDLGLDLRFD